MSMSQRVLSAAAVTLVALVPAWLSAADEEPPVEAAVIVVEASGDGNNSAPVVVQVQASNAGGQAIVVRTRGGNQFGAYDIREEVDPRDGVEKFVLLLPGGPLIVEATMTLGGLPFRTEREGLIDEMLSAGDVNEDGTVTWEEALTNSRFTYGRVFPDQQRAQYVQMLDRDENGEVDRREARGFLAVVFQGPAFYLTGGLVGPGSGRNLVSVNGQLLNYGGAPTNVWALLDADDDGTLSDTEIAGAGERLKSRDADDNDLLYTTEIGGIADNSSVRRPVNVRNAQQIAAQQPAVLLGPTTNAETLFAAIQGRYQAEDGGVLRSSFSTSGELFDRLDANGDHLLSESEAAGLNEVEPQVRLNVDLGRAEGESTLSLTYLEGARRLPGETPGAAGIELPGVTVTFEVNTSATVTPDYETIAQQRMDQLDGDNNDYLEFSEMPQNLGEPQFRAWDVNGDGKVFKDEIVESYTRALAPQQTQVQAGVTQSGDPLFPALDLSSDSRLSLREMKTAHVQLATLDADGDGRISRIEVPVSFVVNFRIGNGGYGGYQYRVVAAGSGGFQPAAASPGDGPAWFLRMDRNGDGDVTLKEFLGDREAFEELDTNGDGFIEPAEAKAVEGDGE